jgi:hypothetical protein
VSKASRFNDHIDGLWKVYKDTRYALCGDALHLGATAETKVSHKNICGYILWDMIVPTNDSGDTGEKEGTLQLLTIFEGYSSQSEAMNREAE